MCFLAMPRVRLVATLRVGTHEGIAQKSCNWNPSIKVLLRHDDMASDVRQLGHFLC